MSQNKEEAESIDDNPSEESYLSDSRTNSQQDLKLESIGRNYDSDNSKDSFLQDRIDDKGERDFTQRQSIPGDTDDKDQEQLGIPSKGKRVEKGIGQLMKKLKEVEIKLEYKNAEIYELKNKSNEYQSRNTKLEDQMPGLKKKLEETETKLNLKEEQIVEGKKQIDFHAEQVNRIEQEIRDKLDEIKKVEKNHSPKTSLLEEYRNKTSKQPAEIRNLEETLCDVNKHLEEAQTRDKLVDEEIMEKKEIVARNQVSINNLQEKMNEIVYTVKNIESSSLIKESKIEEYKNKANQTREDVDKIECEISELTKKLDESREAQKPKFDELNLHTSFLTDTAKLIKIVRTGLLEAGNQEMEFTKRFEKTINCELK